MDEPISEQDRKITDSLFPAIALYAPNRSEQIAAWSGKTTEEIQLLLAMDYPESQLSNANRNLFFYPFNLGNSHCDFSARCTELVFLIEGMQSIRPGWGAIKAAVLTEAAIKN